MLLNMNIVNDNSLSIDEKIIKLFNFIINDGYLEEYKSIDEFFDELAKCKIDIPLYTVSKVCESGYILGFGNDNYHVDEFIYDNYADILADIVNNHGQYTTIELMKEKFMKKCKCNADETEIIPNNEILYLLVSHYN